MANTKVNSGIRTDDREKTMVKAAQGEEAVSGSSDQDRFTRGIRDLGRPEAIDGQFVEAEQNPSDRRDPEESRHNEAGQRVVTQGDLEQGAASKKVNPEGAKISRSQPQTSL